MFIVYVSYLFIYFVFTQNTSVIYHRLISLKTTQQLNEVNSLVVYNWNVRKYYFKLIMQSL